MQRERHTLSEIVEMQVTRDPAFTAIVLDGKALTYSQLNERANQFAHYLRKQGVLSERPVGLLLNRSIELIVALLGVLKAGAIYVPLDPINPVERLLQIISMTDLKLVVTQERLWNEQLARQVELLPLESHWPFIERESTMNLPRLTVPENTAYILSTSGSTGMPKGVCCHHYGAVNLLDDMQERWPITPGMRCSWWTSFSFDVSVLEIFTSLKAGGQLYPVPEEVRLDYPRYWRWLETHQIASAYIPPFAIYDFAEAASSSAYHFVLQRLIVGVEPIAEDVLASLFQSIPGIQIINGYGPTETSIFSTLYEVRQETAQQRRTPIGLPVRGTRLYILDKQGNPTAPGTPGEVYIGGDGLTLGYTHQPALTAERFVPDHCSAIPGARLYKTGDIAWCSQEGVITFVGRNDDQVKLHGYRIELKEVEQTFLRHPAVRESIAFIHHTRSMGEILVAYLVLRTDAETSEDELRLWLQQRLPPPMIPSRIRLLPHFPRTANGKTDKRTLREYENTLEELTPEVVVPQTPNEERVLAIWREVFKNPSLGMQQNFFELGGNSLQATRILALVRQHYQIVVSMKALFEAPTVAQFAQWIDQCQPQRARNQEDRGIDLDQPQVSPVQEGLWLLEQITPHSRVNTLLFRIAFRGPLEKEALITSLMEMRQRHISLRTIFSAGNAGLSVVSTDAPFVLNEVHLENLPEESARKTLIEKKIREITADPIDITYGPPVRFFLLWENPHSCQLLLLLHHIIFDEHSFYIFQQELRDLYLAHTTGEAAQLKELTLDLFAAARWRRRWLQSPESAECFEYWSHKLTDAPITLEFPQEIRQDVPVNECAERQMLTLPASIMPELEALMVQQRITLFILLLTSFAMALQWLGQQNEVVIGAPFAGRTRPGEEELIGFFVNMVALRLSCSWRQTLRQALAHVREVVIEADIHQEVSLSSFLNMLPPTLPARSVPAIQAILHVLTFEHQAQWGDHLSVSFEELETGIAQYDLECICASRNEGLVCVLRYRTALYASEQIRCLLRYFSQIISWMATCPDATLLDLLHESVQREKCVALTLTSSLGSHFVNKGLVELFDEQAAAHPEDIAIQEGTRCVTYADLRKQSDLLARYLQACGVGVETPVAVALEFSVEHVLAVLAIAKAGGCCTFIDPAFPAAALKALVQKVDARLLITAKETIVDMYGWPCQILDLVTDQWQQVGAECDIPAHTPLEAGAMYLLFPAEDDGVSSGVVLEQRGLLNLFVWQQRAFAIVPGERVCVLKNSDRELTTRGIWTALLAGASLSIAPSSIQYMAQQLRDWLCREEITIALLPAAVVQVLVRLSWLQPCNLRLLISEGDSVCLPVSNDYPFELVNSYGSSETTLVASAGVLRREDAGRFPSVGFSPDNVSLLIVDQDLYPLPPGTPGEIVVSGLATARGYFQDPELTAGRFVPHPFSSQPGQRLYRTGEWGRLREDLALEYLGRKELHAGRDLARMIRKVEYVLGTHSAVIANAVVALDDTGQLIAFVVLSEEVTSAALLGFIAQKVSPALVPTRVVQLPSLPLTGRDRIDRKALQIQARRLSTEGSACVAPRTPVETELHGWWSEVFQRTTIGVTDPFFALGGNSLQAIHILLRIRQQYGIELGVTTFFTHTTIAELAAEIEKQRSQHKASGSVINPAPRGTKSLAQFFGEKSD